MTAADPLDRVAAAAARVAVTARAARVAVVERDAAVLAAFEAGKPGPAIAAAAGLSVPGVHRAKERAAGFNPPSRQLSANDRPSPAAEKRTTKRPEP